MLEPEFVPDQHQVLVVRGAGRMGWEGGRRQRGRIILGKDKNNNNTHDIDYVLIHPIRFPYNSFIRNPQVLTLGVVQQTKTINSTITCHLINTHKALNPEAIEPILPSMYMERSRICSSIA